MGTPTKPSSPRKCIRLYKCTVFSSLPFSSHTSTGIVARIRKIYNQQYFTERFQLRDNNTSYVSREWLIRETNTKFAAYPRAFVIKIRMFVFFAKHGRKKQAVMTLAGKGAYNEGRRVCVNGGATPRIFHEKNYKCSFHRCRVRIEGKLPEEIKYIQYCQEHRYNTFGP